MSIKTTKNIGIPARAGGDAKDRLTQDNIRDLEEYITSLDRNTKSFIEYEAPNKSDLELLALAQIIERFHDIKRRSLGEELSALGDPVWKILIRLVIAGEEKQTISLAEMAQLISLPETSVVRYINILESKGYIIQSPHPAGQMASQLHLTKLARAIMRDTLLALSAT
ncbi:hypothetical protein [Parasphingorhabdus sp.]|uniref:hypothetical protein n=1 Tax=Parasphingorhabdus sp. TaxID=2709688 RepID=UPI003C7219F9